MYPYLATADIDGIQYGIGTGSNKKQAKIDSARATLQILLTSINNFQTDDSNESGNDIQENNYFEHYKVSVFSKLEIYSVINYSIHFYSLICFRYLTN